MKKLNLKGLRNARDISYSDIKEKKLLRSENLSKLTDEDVKVLKEEYNLKYIIDLRTHKERKQKDIIIPNVEYIHIPMNTYKDPIYKVDKESGLLTKKIELPVSGAYPKDVSLFPDNRHLVSLNQESNTMTFFTVNFDNNTLVMN